jgi:hypothetical protein
MCAIVIWGVWWAVVVLLSQNFLELTARSRAVSLWELREG